MHKHGFTLAEILIAMAIVGVVAALTVPSLTEAYQKRIMTTQLKRAYYEISQAGALALTDEAGADDFRFSKAIKDRTFLGKYLAVSKDGGWYGASSYGFVHDKYANYDIFHSEMGDNWDEFKCGLTKVGAAVCVNKRATGILDINGENGPNIVGKDAFSIGFNPDGSINNEYSYSLESIMEHGWDIDNPDWH